MGYIVKNVSGGSLGFQLETDGLSLQAGASYDVSAVCSTDWILYNATFRSLISGGQLVVTEDTITGQSDQFPGITEDSSNNVSMSNDLNVAGDLEVDGSLTVEGNITGQVDITAVDDLTVNDLITAKDMTLSGDLALTGDLTTDLAVLGAITKTEGSITTKPTEQTTADLTLYVRSTGDDSNTGLTEGAALATLQAAIDKVPDTVKHDVVINVGEGNFVGGKVYNRIVLNGKAITIVGVLGAPTLAGGTASGTADGGSKTQLVDSGQAWVNDALIGMLVKIGSEYRFIWDNDGTTIEVVGEFAATCNGKAYEIVEHKTAFTSAAAGAIGNLEFRGNMLGDRTGIALQDVKTSGATAGCATITGFAPRITRVRCTGSYYGLFTQGAQGEWQIDDLFVDDSGNAGIVLTSNEARMAINKVYRVCALGNASYGVSIDWCGAAIGIVDLYCIDNGNHGIYAAYGGSVISLYHYFRSQGNAGDGAQFWGCPSVDFSEVYIYDNDDNGISLYSTPFCDVDSGTIDNNGGWGVEVDVDTGSNRSHGSFFNAWGTIQISNNTAGGIVLCSNSGAALRTVTGTGNGTYGVNCRSRSRCVVDDACTITGTSGDCTVDDGSTSLTWAGNFGSDGDVESNANTFAMIERKDA